MSYNAGDKSQKGSDISNVTFVLPWQDKVDITPIGLKRVRNIALDDNDRLCIADHCAGLINTVHWVVADLLLDTEESVKHGDKSNHYAEVAARLPFKVEARTLENWATTARAWPYRDRAMQMTFYMHLELNQCTRDERDDLIGRCVSEGWTKRRLIEERERLPRFKTMRQGKKTTNHFGSDFDHAHEQAVLSSRVEQLEFENEQLRSALGGCGTSSSYSPIHDQVQELDHVNNDEETLPKKARDIKENAYAVLMNYLKKHNAPLLVVEAVKILYG